MVGVLTTSYPRFPGDAAGSFVAARVRALRAAGEAVEVLAAGAPGREERDDDGGVMVTRVPFAVPGAPPLFYGAGAPEELEARPWPALLAGVAFFARLTAAARARVSRWQRLESHWLLPAGLAAAQIAAGRAHRAHAHSGDVALLERLPAGASLARHLCASGAQVVFASEDLRRRFARLAGPPADAALARALVEPAAQALQPRALAPTERAQLRRRLGLAGFVVLGVGRLVPIKGYDVLVRALARVSAPERPALVLLGDGPERGALARLAHAHAVDLRLPGVVPHAEVADFLAAADLFVHPCRPLPNGRSEGMPLAVLEALAAGLPVIASASGGLPELAGRPGLFLVPPDDADALARMLRNREECYALTTGNCVAAAP